MEDRPVDIKAEKSQCKYCRWWLGFETGDGTSLGGGECKRFPPTETEEDARGSHIGIWPITKEDDSCGEFGRILAIGE